MQLRSEGSGFGSRDAANTDSISLPTMQYINTKETHVKYLAISQTQKIWIRMMIVVNRVS